MNEPIRRTVTTRRVLVARVRREPAAQAAVWRQRRRSYVSSSIAWLVLAIVGAMSSMGRAFEVLAIAACTLSAAVVVKATVIVSRSEAQLRRS